MQNESLPAAIADTIRAELARHTRTLYDRLNTLERRLTEASTPEPSLIKAAELSRRHPVWTEPAIRYAIYRSVDRTTKHGEYLPSNGLAECGAIVRLGRSVLIDERKWMGWARSGGGSYV